MPLDVKKLKESGYTETELVDILGKKMGANVARAREANVSDSEILTALAARATGDEVKPKRGIVGEFVAGMKQGAYQLPQMVGGVTKLVGDAVGSETVSDLGRDAIGYWGEKAAEHAPTVGSFTDIEDAGDAAQYAAHGLGALVPMVGASVLGGGIGGLAGRGVAARTIAKQGLAGEIAKQTAEKAVTRGALAGAGAASYGMEAGSIYSDQAEQGIEKPGLAAAWAVPAAIMDIIPEARVLSRIPGFDNLLKAFPTSEGKNLFVRMTKEATKQGGIEGGTEFVQTLMERAGADKAVFTSEGLLEAANAGIIGSLGGAIPGAGGALVSKPDTTTTTQGAAEDEPVITPAPEMPPPSGPLSRAVNQAPVIPAIEPTGYGDLTRQMMQEAQPAPTAEAQPAIPQESEAVSYNFLSPQMRQLSEQRNGAPAPAELLPDEERQTTYNQIFANPDITPISREALAEVEANMADPMLAEQMGAGRETRGLPVPVSPAIDRMQIDEELPKLEKQKANLERIIFDKEGRMKKKFPPQSMEAYKRVTARITELAKGKENGNLQGVREEAREPEAVSPVRGESGVTQLGIDATHIYTGSIPADEVPQKGATPLPETASAPRPPAKEPWEMTRKEFLANSGKEGIYITGASKEGLDILGVPEEQQRPDYLNSATLVSFPSEPWVKKVQEYRKRYGSGYDTWARAAVVEKALSEGRTVPPEVLADYPDLQRAQETADSSTRPADVPKETKPAQPFIAEDAKKGSEVNPQVNAAQSLVVGKRKPPALFTVPNPEHKMDKYVFADDGKKLSLIRPDGTVEKASGFIKLRVEALQKKGEVKEYVAPQAPSESKAIVPQPQHDYTRSTPNLVRVMDTYGNHHYVDRDELAKGEKNILRRYNAKGERLEGEKSAIHRGNIIDQNDAEAVAVAKRSKRLSSLEKKAEKGQLTQEELAEAKGLQKQVVEDFEKRLAPEEPGTTAALRKRGEVKEYSAPKVEKAQPAMQEPRPDGIYQTKVKIGDSVETRYAVPAPESMGYKRGHGDELYPTIEEAEAALKERDEREAANAKFQREQDARIAKEKAEQDAKDDTQGFYDTLSTMAAGKAKKTLEKGITHKGVVTRIKEFVEKKVADGYTIGEWDGKAVFKSPDGSFYEQSVITKTAIDYARHLIGLQEQTPDTPAEVVKEAVKTAKEQAPNPVVKESLTGEKGEKAATDKESLSIDTLAAHDTFDSRLREGTATAEELKAAFASLLENEAAIKEELGKLTKDELLKRLGGMGRYRYKNDKKADIVGAVWRDMLSDYNLNRSISYNPFGGGYEKALKNSIESTTDKDIASYAEEVAKAREDARERIEGYKQALTDPQTLDDFRTFFDVEKSKGKTLKEARRSLTPEQRERYDNLAAEASRTRRKSQQDDRRTEVRAAAQTTTGEVIETKHTKTGVDLFVVKAAERVEREIYNQWNATAKKLGGWYSAFKGNGAVPGFQFKTREAADAFLQFLGGDTTGAKEAVQARRSAFEDDRSQSAVERLNEMADRLEEQASASLAQDRKANTARRARMAASAEASAQRDIALAKTMRNLAEAIAGGKAQFLDRVRTKAQVEMLTGMLKSAHYEWAREESKNGRGRLEDLYDKAPTKDAVDFAEYPTYSAYRSDLARLGRELEAIDGAKKLGAQITKLADDVTDAYVKFAKENLHKVSTFARKDGAPAVFSSRDAALESIRRSGFKGKAIVLSVKRGENIIVMGPEMAKEHGLWEGDNDKLITLPADLGAEIVAKNKALGKRNRLDVPWHFETANEKRTRLAAMGIETGPELRAALREYLNLREQPQEADKVKELERQMVGRKNDGLDFFPTPASVAQEMVETADIQEGMAVLEPSAGMGHIAGAIRESGVEPDVVEMSNDRRELLEAKGFNVVGRDFMDVGGQYDRIIMNPPFSDRRDAQHVQHAYTLLKPNGRLVAIMGEGVFFGQDKKAVEFREWLESVGGTSEKLEEGTFLDPSLPVNTGVNARMVVIDKAGDGARLSLQDEISSPLMTVTDVKAAIADMRLKWKNAPPIEIVRSTDDLPSHLAQEIQSMGAEGGVRGVFENGTAYLVADNIYSDQEAVSVLLHEAVGHYGLRQYLGAEFNPILGQVALAYGNKGLRRIADKYGLDLTKKEDRLVAAEEKLAEMAESGEKPKIMERAIAVVRQWLRSIGVNVKMSDAEIRVLISKAHGFVERGAQGKSFYDGARFMVADGDGPATLSPKEGEMKNAIDIDGLQTRDFESSPMYTVGYRYGEAPESGNSYNTMTQKYEAGVSMAAIAGLGEVGSFAVSGAAENREKFYYEGDIVGYGGDDEPVLANIKRITEKEYNRKLRTDEVKASALQWAVNKWRTAERLNRMGYSGYDSQSEKRKAIVEKLINANGNFPRFSLRDLTNDLRPDFVQVSKHPKVQGFLNSVFKSAKNLNVVNRNINTMYHVAEKLAAKGKPQFKRFHDKALDFLSDTSMLAINAELLAPKTFRRVSGFRDAVKSIGEKGITKEQEDRISEAIFKGTLAGGGNPLDGAIWTDKELQEKFKLNEYERAIYRERLASAAYMLQEHSKSFIARYAQMHDGVTFDRTLDLSEMAEDVLAQIRERIEDAQAALDAHAEEYDQSIEGLDRKSDEFKKLRRESVAFESKQESMIDTFNATVGSIEDLVNKTNRLVDAGYFPLKRFGQFWVSAVDKDGNAWESTHETEREAQTQKVILENDPDYQGSPVTVSVGNPDEYKLFAGMSPDVVQLFAEHLDAEEAGAYQEYLKRTVKQNSALARMIHRKGVAGYSTDSRRTLAAFILSNARSASSNYNVLAMKRLAGEIPKHEQGDVRQMAVNLMEYLQQPKEEHANVRAFLFWQYLGFALDSALMNLTQPVMMTGPALAAHTSVDKVVKYMNGAGKIMKAPDKMDKELQQALSRAEKEGVTAPQDVYQMQAIASNRLLSAQSGMGVKVRRMIELSGRFFEISETFNRKLSFIAAHEIATKEKGLKGESAYDFAAKVVTETQGNYTKANRPVRFRGGLAPIFTFKQFAVMYLELFSRLMAKPETRRAGLYMLGLLFLASGAEGLPFYEDGADILDTILQWMGFSANTKRAVRDKAHDLLGKTGGDIVTKGLPSTFLPYDVQMRLSFGNLIPGTAAFKKSNALADKGREISEVFGAPGGVISSLFDGLELLAIGRLYEAGKVAILPRAARNLLDGTEWAVRGYSTDPKGRKGEDVDLAEATGKMVGFRSTRLADKSRVKSDYLADKRILQVKRESIINQMVDGILESDPQKKAEARKEWLEWNRKNPPEMRIRIRPQDIGRRVKAARLTGSERFTKSLTKAQQQRARMELED